MDNPELPPQTYHTLDFWRSLMSALSRRDTLKLAMQAGAAMAVAQLAPQLARATPSVDPGKKVRLGFIGVGDRGTGLLRVALNVPNVEVLAVCDINHANLTRAQDAVVKAGGKKPEGYEKDPHDYRRLLEREDIDGVVIATPQELHAEMAIDGFKAKKVVGSEVPACTTIDECHAMIKAHREFGARYMMLENYLYSQPVMMVQNMVDQGVFGDLTYGFGEYVHEIREMRFTKKGTLTWRGENVLHTRGIVYPTHAAGPVCRWLGINRGDKLQTLVAMDSKAAGNRAYAIEKFGENSEQAKIDWENGDTNQALIRTAQGRLIEVRYDTASPRPSGMGQYSLQGTKASYDSAFGEHKMFIEGKSKPHQWDDLEKYTEQYQHPYWKERGAEAGKTGHGGGDWFVINDFINYVAGGPDAKSPVDIVDALTWTSIRPLSEKSIRDGNKPIEMPDFSKDA
jgi:predicted dehydrogenase